MFLNRLLQSVLWILFALSAGAYGVLAGRSIGVPGPSGAAEVTVLEQAARLARQDALYVDSMQGSAVAMMPAYPSIVSLVGGRAGSRPVTPRAVAVLVMVLVAALVLVVVRIETESLTLGAAGCGVMLAGSALLAGPPGAAGAEALMLLFVLASGLALREPQAGVGIPCGAVMLAIACFVHPQAVWFAAAGFIYVALAHRERLLSFALPLVLCGGGGYILLSYLLGPWFNYNAWDLPLGTLVFDPSAILRYLGVQVLGTLGVLAVGAVLWFALPDFSWREMGGIWTCMGLAAIGSGAVATQSTTAGPQALLPTVTMIAIAGPIAIQKLTASLARWPDSDGDRAHRALLVTLLLQFVALFSRLPLARFWPSR